MDTTLSQPPDFSKRNAPPPVAPIVQSVQAGSDGGGHTATQASPSGTIEAHDLLYYCFGDLAVQTTEPQYAESIDARPEPPDEILVEKLQPADPDEAANGLNLAMRTLLIQLDQTNKQLQSASYRIGFLESEIEEYEKQLRSLPDLEAKLDKVVHLERDNEKLRKLVPILEGKVQSLPVLEERNRELQLQIKRQQGRREAGLWGRIVTRITRFADSV